MKKIQLFAHRGSKTTHPENTLSAFMEAERVGADGIEFDVQLSSDGEIVIIHDETLDRTTTMTGDVRSYTAEQLKQADAGIHKSIHFRDERIPFLGEVFQWATGNHLLMNVELKTDRISYVGIEQKVINLIREFHLEDRIVLSSFNHHSIDIAKELAPDIECALLFEDLPANIKSILEKKQHAGFHPRANTLTKELTTYARQLGYKVRPWIANTEADVLQLASYGVDVIMTDCPEQALQWLNKQ